MLYLNSIVGETPDPRLLGKIVLTSVFHLYKGENVELLVDDYQDALNSLTNAGAVFVGEYSTEPVGDYFCGTNHILPTCGTARFSSGMSVQEFMRGYSVIHYTESTLKNNADYIVQLAESEKMMAHAAAVKVRKRALGEL